MLKFARIWTSFFGDYLSGLIVRLPYLPCVPKRNHW